jgi:hypothetical protein
MSLTLPMGGYALQKQDTLHSTSRTAESGDCDPAHSSMPTKVSVAIDHMNTTRLHALSTSLSPATICGCVCVRLCAPEQRVCAGCSKHKPVSKFCRHATCRDCRKEVEPQASPLALPPPRMRSKRPYEEIGPTQRWVRRKEGREALAEIGVPATALSDHKPAAAAVLGLSTADRRRIRTASALAIPGEQRIAECKKALAHTHGCATAAFTHPLAGKEKNVRVGTYVTDPLRLLRSVAGSSPWLAVGGDKGGGFTKLGVTYTAKGEQHFLILLVFEGDDHYEDMHELRSAPNLTTLTGESAQHTHIFAVLQHIINNHQRCFLNGDWPFISCILAHKGHAALYPCPICIVDRDRLLSKANYRRPVDGNSLHHVHDAFLTIPSNRIVPTPLHLFLGINNRLIFEAFKELVGEQQLTGILLAVKSKHSAGCGGLSDLYALNGPEIARWIKQDRCAEIAVLAAASANTSIKTQAKIAQMAKWMRHLHTFLLHGRQWTPTELFVFRAVIRDIYAHWSKTTGDRAFPKLHMLQHSVEFAARWGILGAASEAQIESCHFTFKSLYHVQHRNMSQQPLERVRRCLADVVAAAAGTVATAEIPIAARSLLSLASGRHNLRPSQAA